MLRPLSGCRTQLQPTTEKQGGTSRAVSSAGYAFPLEASWLQSGYVITWDSIGGRCLEVLASALREKGMLKIYFNYSALFPNQTSDIKTGLAFP